MENINTPQPDLKTAESLMDLLQGFSLKSKEETKKAKAEEIRQSGMNLGQVKAFLHSRRGRIDQIEASCVHYTLFFKKYNLDTTEALNEEEYENLKELCRGIEKAKEFMENEKENKNEVEIEGKIDQIEMETKIKLFFAQHITDDFLLQFYKRNKALEALLQHVPYETLVQYAQQKDSIERTSIMKSKLALYHHRLALLKNAINNKPTPKIIAALKKFVPHGKIVNANARKTKNAGQKLHQTTLASLITTNGWTENEIKHGAQYFYPQVQGLACNRTVDYVKEVLQKHAQQPLANWDFSEENKTKQS